MSSESAWKRGRVLFSSAVTSIRVHHWVIWWFFVGVACGIVALLNIFFRDLTQTQERAILLLGVLHWVLGGLVCYAFEGIQVVRNERHVQNPARNPVRARSHHGPDGEGVARCFRVCDPRGRHF